MTIDKKRKRKERYLREQLDSLHTIHIGDATTIVIINYNN